MKRDPGIVRAYLVRGTILWVLLRLVLSMMAALGGSGVILSPTTTLALILLIPLLTYFDIARRGEAILLANLGVSLRRVLVISTMPAIVGEVLINIVTRIA